MAYPILGTPKPAFFDSSGVPLVSGTITIQDPDDSSAKNSYPTAADADADTNGVSTAITLDSRGEPTSTQLWGRDGEDYKAILKDSSGSTVYTLDEIRLPQQERQAVVTAGSGDATPSVDGVRILQLRAAQTYTNFDDGQVGDRLLLYGATSSPAYITNSGNVILRDSLDIAFGSSDTMELINVSASTWAEVSRSANTSIQYLGPNYKKTASANVPLTSSTLAEVPDLSAFKLLGGTFYEFSGYLEVNADAAGRDLELDFITDTAFTNSAYTWISVDSGNPLVVDQGETQPLITAVANIDIDGTGRVGILISGHVETGGTTSSMSTVDTHMANQAGAGTVTVNRGSWIQFKAISN